MREQRQECEFSRVDVLRLLRITRDALALSSVWSTERIQLQWELGSLTNVMEIDEAECDRYPDDRFGG